LKVPKRTATRPATDLVKGAIFSILENTCRDWRLVLDLFSGSGSLGIEALSSGADWVDFVERDPGCCAIIRENLERTKFSDQAHVYCCSVSKAISFLDKEYNIILMDPPYSNPSIGRILEQIAASKALGPETTLIVTHSPHHPLNPSYASLRCLKEYRHGDSCIAVYQKEGD